MGLYDNFHAINSKGPIVKQHSGAPVAELVQVSQQLQNYYDKAQENLDYTTRFFNSLKAAPQDEPAFKEFKARYADQLQKLSQRPDLENALRDTTMLARDLPTAYAPFAQNLKEINDAKDFYQKQVDAGKLNPDEAQKYLARDLGTYKGLQFDPQTGQYINPFKRGYSVDTYNYAEAVDNAMKNVKPKETGWKYDKIGSEWVVTNGREVKRIEPERIKEIVGNYLNADSKHQAYISQMKQLGTYNMPDYSKVPLEELGIDLNRVIGSQPKLNDKGQPVIGKNKKVVSDPITLKQYIESQVAQGRSINDVMRGFKEKSIEDNYMRRALNYAVPKYEQNDVETMSSVQANQYGVKQFEHDLKKKDEVTPITEFILQPDPKTQFQTAADATTKVEDLRKYAVKMNQDYMAWMNLNKVTLKGGNPDNPNAKWVDASGKDVTSEARKYLLERDQANTLRMHVNNLIKDAEAKAGLSNIDPKVKAEAQKAYDAEFKKTEGYSSSSAGIGSGGTLTKYNEAERVKNAQNAYNAVLRKNYPDKFNKYEEIFKKNVENRMTTVGLQKFQGKFEGLNKQLEENFNNLVVNLDKDGLDGGTQGLEWAQGESAGTALKANDYKKIIGKAEYAGHGFVNGKLYDFFKVGPTKVNKQGELVTPPVLVRKPAAGGVLENMIKSGSTNEAHVALSQRLNEVNSSYGKPIQLTLGNNLKVSFRPTTSYDRDNNYVNPNSNFILTVDQGGESADFGVNNVDEAVTNILTNLKRQK
jgi:hypothetical protein